MDKIEQLLKEATKDILSNESLQKLTEAFSAIVTKTADEKAKLQVEAALVKQDAEYTEKLKVVLENIDKDHSEKMATLIEKLDEDRTSKLKRVVEAYDAKVKAYETGYKKDAKLFKESVIKNVSKFLDKNLEKHVPQDMLKEAVENTRSRLILRKIADLISVNEIALNEKFVDALKDGKRQIDESNAKIEELTKKLNLVTENSLKNEAKTFLIEQTKSFPKAKKNYVLRMLEGKNVEFIKENFNYVVELFDKDEDDEIEGAKKSSTSRVINENIDVSKVEKTEKTINESVEVENEGMKDYLSELSRS